MSHDNRKVVGTEEWIVDVDKIRCDKADKKWLMGLVLLAMFALVVMYCFVCGVFP